MKNQIIADGCCDMPPALKREMGIISVPLTMMPREREFRDDETLDISEFSALVKEFSGKTTSASPAPHLYQNAKESKTMWGEGIITSPASGVKYKYWVKHFLDKLGRLGYSSIRTHGLIELIGRT